MVRVVENDRPSMTGGTIASTSAKNDDIMSNRVPQVLGLNRKQDLNNCQADFQSSSEQLTPLVRQLHVSVLLFRVQSLIRKLEFERAEEILDEAIKQADDLKSELLRAKCHVWAGTIYLRLGRMECAMNQFTDAVPVLDYELPETTLLRRCFVKYEEQMLGHLTRTLANEDDAIKHWHILKQLALNKTAVKSRQESQVSIASSVDLPRQEVDIMMDKLMAGEVYKPGGASQSRDSLFETLLRQTERSVSKSTLADFVKPMTEPNMQRSRSNGIVQISSGSSTRPLEQQKTVHVDNGTESMQEASLPLSVMTKSPSRIVTTVSRSLDKLANLGQVQDSVKSPIANHSGSSIQKVEVGEAVKMELRGIEDFRSLKSLRNSLPWLQAGEALANGLAARHEPESPRKVVELEAVSPQTVTWEPSTAVTSEPSETPEQTKDYGRGGVVASAYSRFDDNTKHAADPVATIELIEGFGTAATEEVNLSKTLTTSSESRITENWKEDEENDELEETSSIPKDEATQVSGRADYPNALVNTIGALEMQTPDEMQTLEAVMDLEKPEDSKNSSEADEETTREEIEEVVGEIVDNIIDEISDETIEKLIQEGTGLEGLANESASEEEDAETNPEARAALIQRLTHQFEQAFARRFERGYTRLSLGVPTSSDKIRVVIGRGNSMHSYFKPQEDLSRKEGSLSVLTNRGNAATSSMFRKSCISKAQPLPIDSRLSSRPPSLSLGSQTQQLPGHPAISTWSHSPRTDVLKMVEDVRQLSDALSPQKASERLSPAGSRRSSLGIDIPMPPPLSPMRNNEGSEISPLSLRSPDQRHSTLPHVASPLRASLSLDDELIEYPDDDLDKDLFDNLLKSSQHDADTPAL